MQKRCRKFIDLQRSFNKEAGALARLIVSIGTPARFPDSGYYYAQKQRTADALWDDFHGAGYPDQWYKDWQNRLHKRIAIARYNYFEKVQVVDQHGCEWTASDMDAAMCGY